MAIDTAAKRFSMMNMGAHHRILIIPDGTISAPDRAHLLGLYSGIALAAPVVSGIVAQRRHGKKPRQRRRAT